MNYVDFDSRITLEFSEFEHQFRNFFFTGEIYVILIMKFNQLMVIEPGNGFLENIPKLLNRKSVLTQLLAKNNFSKIFSKVVSAISKSCSFSWGMQSYVD